MRRLKCFDDTHQKLFYSYRIGYLTGYFDSGCVFFFLATGAQAEITEIFLDIQIILLVQTTALCIVLNYSIIKITKDVKNHCKSLLFKIQFCWKLCLMCFWRLFYYRFIKYFRGAFLVVTMPFQEGGLHSRVSLKGTIPSL